MDGSHNIFLGKELNSLLKNVTSKDRSVIMKHFNGEGNKGSRKFHVVDLPKAESAVLTFKGYLKRMIGVRHLLLYNLIRYDFIVSFTD